MCDGTAGDFAEASDAGKMTDIAGEIKPGKSSVSFLVKLGKEYSEAEPLDFIGLKARAYPGLYSCPAFERKIFYALSNSLPLMSRQPCPSSMNELVCLAYCPPPFRLQGCAKTSGS